MFNFSFPGIVDFWGKREKGNTNNESDSHTLAVRCGM
jgi:hypothetical protein